MPRFLSQILSCCDSKKNNGDDDDPPHNRPEDHELTTLPQATHADGTTKSIPEPTAESTDLPVHQADPQDGANDSNQTAATSNTTVPYQATVLQAVRTRPGEAHAIMRARYSNVKNVLAARQSMLENVRKGRTITPPEAHDAPDLTGDEMAILSASESVPQSFGQAMKERQATMDRLFGRATAAV